MTERTSGRRICRTHAKLTAAAAGAGAGGLRVARSFSRSQVPVPWTPALSLAAGGAAMAALFLLLARLLRVGELRGLRRLG